MRLTTSRVASALFVASLPARVLWAQSHSSAPADTIPCPSCAEWNAPHAPLRIFGNSYYVGTNGLTSILITSPRGHILIDGALPQSVAQITNNIRTSGFRLEDVKLILNSHVHWDHAGGIGELARLTGAGVAASKKSAPVLKTGKMSKDDPQFGIIPDIAPSARVRPFSDGETLRVGDLAVVAHLTPGHTPGGTSWTWTSCEEKVCRTIVYGDSQSAISADNFFFTKSAAYPKALSDFERGFAFFEKTTCDILITPHPSASEWWERVAKRDAGTRDALVDPSACRRYAATARERLAKRIADERAAK